MKRILLILTASLLTMSAYSQQFVCKQDTVHFYQNNYRGKLSWQKSDNGTDWSPLPGATRDTLMVVATSPAYFRSEVIEGKCRPYYSDVVHLEINVAPQVELIIRDSVCINEIPFILTGGLPAGGDYWGSAVIDGKFCPAVVGAGKHQVFYRFVDSLTTCSDTTFAFVTVTNLPNLAQAGNDLTSIPADSVLLDANVPENGIGTWTLVSGSYGHFTDSHSPKSWLVKDSTNLNFTVKWTIAGDCGQSSDQLTVSFFPISKNPCPNAPTVTDVDGHVYPTIQIGNQCWMAKNLNTGRVVNSTIRVFDHSDLSNNGIIEKYALNNNLDSLNLYGGLYDWDEAMGYTDVEGAQGICPEGWHIPTNAEWTILDGNFPLKDAGKHVKIGGSSGFEGYYAGSRNPLGDFSSSGVAGFFWASSSWIFESNNEGIIRMIEACNNVLSKDDINKKTAISVRCVKNNQ